MLFGRTAVPLSSTGCGLKRRDGEACPVGLALCATFLRPNFLENVGGTSDKVFRMLQVSDEAE